MPCGLWYAAALGWPQHSKEVHLAKAILEIGILPGFAHRVKFASSPASNAEIRRRWLGLVSERSPKIKEKTQFLQSQPKKSPLRGRIKGRCAASACGAGPFSQFHITLVTILGAEPEDMAV